MQASDDSLPAHSRKIDKARTFARHERSDVRHIGVPPGVDVRLLATYVVRQFSEEEQKIPKA